MRGRSWARGASIAAVSAVVAFTSTGAYALWSGGVLGAPAELNPRAAKTLNPCAAKTPNPCAAKTLNPCAAKTLNPCATKTLNPCQAKPGDSGAMANPCGAAARVNPARIKQPAGVELAGGSRSELVSTGERLWNDRMLGKSGLACASCHVDRYGQMLPSFGEPYPHEVAMPKQQAGLSEVNAAEMVQFCMVVPMAAEPLDWDSTELAALAAYVESIQPGYRPAGVPGANPCNPCSMKANPCSSRAMEGNPCSP